MIITRTVVAALVTLPLPAMAEQDWRYTGTFYGWLPGITTTVDTPLGEVEAEIEFSDILENLDFAFLAALEARNGRWAVVGDLQYFDLGAEASSGIGGIDSVEIDSQITVLGGYALYDVSNSPDMRIELGGGLRYYDATFETDVSGTPSLTLTTEGNWADAVLSARVRQAFNDDWFGVAYADIGGFGLGDSSDLTWQAYLVAGYNLNESWSAVAGYRHLMFERDFDGTEITSDTGGPVIGFQRQF